MHDFCPMQDLPFLQQISIPAYKKRKLGIAQAIILAEMLEKKEAADYLEIKTVVGELFQRVIHMVDSMHETLARALQDLKGKVQQSLYYQNIPEAVEYVLANSQSLLSVEVSLFDIPILTTISSTRSTLETQILQFSSMDFSLYILARLRDAKLGKVAISSTATAQQEEQDSKYCPILMGNILRKYYGGNSSKLGLVELAYAPKLDQESGYAFMGKDKLFCCGGLEASDTAFLIGCSNSQVTIIPCMSQGRSCPGVVCFENSSYVFGGRQGEHSLTVCEKFANAEKWEIIPEQMLRPRSAFTPCVHESMIYLTGGIGTNSIETFDPIRISFHSLHCSLPFESRCISFILEDSLYVLQRNELSSLNLKLEEKELKRAKYGVKSEMWSPIAPTVSGRCALFWCYEDRSMISMWSSLTRKRQGIFFSFNVDKRELKEEERFEYVVPA